MGSEYRTAVCTLQNPPGICCEGILPLSDVLAQVTTPCLLRLMLQVMDEADRLLEQGCTDFTVDLEVILAAVPARRQTLLFSATLTDTLRELQGLATNQPFFWEAQAP